MLSGLMADARNTQPHTHVPCGAEASKQRFPRTPGSRLHKGRTRSLRVHSVRPQTEPTAERGGCVDRETPHRSHMDHNRGHRESVTKRPGGRQVVPRRRPCPRSARPAPLPPAGWGARLPSAAAAPGARPRPDPRTGQAQSVCPEAAFSATGTHLPLRSWRRGQRRAAVQDIGAHAGTGGDQLGAAGTGSDDGRAATTAQSSESRVPAEGSARSRTGHGGEQAADFVPGLTGCSSGGSPWSSKAVNAVAAAIMGHSATVTASSVRARRGAGPGRCAGEGTRAWMAPGQEDLPPTRCFSHRATDPGPDPSQTEVSYLGTLLEMARSQAFAFHAKRAEDTSTALI